jgi:integrase/recombinase XerD
MSVRPKKYRGQIVQGLYIIDWYPDGRKGKRERIEYQGTEAGARDYELQLLKQHRYIAKDTRRTIRQLLPDFLAAYRVNVSAGTVIDFNWAWKRLEKIFSKVTLTQLAPALIDQYKADRLAQGVKKRTINRELSYLSSIVKWAEDQRLCDPLPFRIKRFPKKQTKSPAPTVHTIEEVAAILEEIKADKRGLFLLMYDAGLRRNEACTLTGAQVDLGTLQIRVIGKGNKERLVPILTDRLKDELTEAKQRAGKGTLYLNPRTGQPFKDIRQALKNAAERAGVDKTIYNHLLRHDHGTHSALAGVDPRAVQRIMGHSNLSTTEIYTHLAGDYLQREGSKFANAIAATKSTVVKKKTTQTRKKSGSPQ